AALQEPVLPLALTRFRLPWRWDGRPSVLQSRATDETGYVQPTRTRLIAERGSRTIYHFNGIASWAVAEDGQVRDVYAEAAVYGHRRIAFAAQDGSAGGRSAARPAADTGGNRALGHQHRAGRYRATSRPWQRERRGCGVR